MTHPRFTAPSFLRGGVLLLGVAAFVCVNAFSWVIQTPSALAAAGINRQIPFQGRVVNLNGTTIISGSFPFTFSLYTVASGGSAIWTETKNLTVTNSIFGTNLGSSTSIPGSVDFNQDGVYLGINFNGDGEMVPRLQIGAVPQAINAEKVSGLTVTNTTGTLTIPNSAVISFGANFTTSANPLSLVTTGATSVTLPTTGVLATLAGTETLTNKTLGVTSFSGNLTPSGSIDLGASGNRFANLYVATADATTLTVSGTSTLGTVTGGTWQGSVIAAQYGGTGLNTSASSGIPTLASGTWSVLANGSNNQCLVVAGGVPTWGSCAASGTVTGTGVAGQLSYWDTSSTIANAAGLTWNAGASQLGIGTTSTLAPLTVRKASSGIVLAVRNTADSATVLSINDTGDIAGNSLTVANGLTVSAGTVSLPSGQIDNAELANSSLTVSAGSNLSGGGSVSLGGTTTLDIVGNPSFATSVTAPTINASTSLQLGGVSINTSGALSNVAYLAQANAFTAGLTVTTTGGNQISSRYDSSNRLDVSTASTGITTLTPVGTAPGIILSTSLAGEITMITEDGRFSIQAADILLGNGFTGTLTLDVTSVEVSGAADINGSGGAISGFTWAGSTIDATLGGTGITTYAAGDMIYASAANTLAKRAIGSNGDCLVVSAGIPTWGTCAQASSTLQAAYGNGNTIALTDARDFALTLANTTTDSNVIFNIATGSTGKFAVQSNGTDVFEVDASGTTITSGGLTVTAGTVSLPAGEIDNTELANSSLTVTAGTGLSGGGAVSLGGSTSLSLPNVGSASTYGSASQVPVFTADAQGRVTGVTPTNIAIAASAITTGQLAPVRGGTGFDSSASTGLSYISGGAWSALANGSNNQCLVVSGGVPTWGSCSAGGGITGSGSTGSITYWDTNTTVAAASGLNFASGALAIGTATTTNGTFTVTRGTSGIAMAVRNTADSATTFSVSDTGAVIGTSLGLGSGAITSGLINGQTISSAANLTGSLTIANGLTVTAGTVSLPNGSIDNAELANASLTVTAGTNLSGGGSVALGSSTTLNVVSNPTFSGVVTASAAGTGLSVTNNATIGGTLNVDGISVTDLAVGADALFASNVEISGELAVYGGINNDNSGITNAGTISGATISGASNTLTNIGNGSLTNSSLTVTAGTNLSGGGSVSLGGSTTLNIVSNPTFTGLITGSNTGGTALALTGAPGASATQSLLRLGNAIVGGDADGTFIGLNAISGYTGNLVDLQLNGVSEFSINEAGSVVAGNISAGTLTAGTYNGQTISSSASFTGSLTVASGFTVTAGAVSLPAGSVANAALANSSITVTAGTGLSGGGSVALGSSVSLNLPNIGTLGTYGSATQVPVFTTDAQGRITGVTNTTIAGIDAGLLDGLDSTDFLRATASTTFTGTNARTLTVQSSLAAGARSSALLSITQADNVTNSSTAALLSITNSDETSTVAPLTVTNAAAGGEGIRVLTGNGATSGAVLSGDNLTLENNTTGLSLIVTSEGITSPVDTESFTVNLMRDATSELIVVNTEAGQVANINLLDGSLLTNSVTRLTNGGTLQNVTYNGNTIAAQYGGTGQASYAVGDLLYASGATALSKLAAGVNGQCLVLASGIPSWSSCATAAVTLQAAYDNGNSIALTNARNLGFTLQDTATDPNFLINIATGSSGRFAVQSNGTDVLSVTNGDITASVGIIASQFQVQGGGACSTFSASSLIFDPSCSGGAGISGDGTDITVSPNPAGSFYVAGAGSLGLVGSTSGVISVTTQAVAGTYNFNLPTTAGSAGYVLTSAGGGATAMTWTDPSSLSVTSATNLAGGTAGQIPYQSGVGATAFVGGTTGQVLVSNGTSAPSFINLASTITAGTNIGITGTTSPTVNVVNNPTFSGLVTASAALSVTGGIDNNSGGITETGAVAGATTIDASGLITGTGGLSITGATINLNASSNFATNIGTGTSTGAISLGGGLNTFALDSTALDVSTTGALSGITTLSMSGAITAATATNTINGLIINTGALSGVTSISSSGGYTQTGTNANTFTGATTLSAAGTALTVTNNATIGGILSLTGVPTASSSTGLAIIGSGTFSGSSSGTQLAVSAATGFGGDLINAQSSSTSTFVTSTAGVRINYGVWNAVYTTAASGSVSGVDTGGYTDITANANAGNTQLFGSSASLQRTYFGFAKGLPGTYMQYIRASGTTGGSSAVWEYWNGSAWTTSNLTQADMSASGPLVSSSNNTGAATTINGVTAYWYRVTLNGAYSVVPNGRLTFVANGASRKDSIALLVSLSGVPASVFNNFSAVGTLFGGIVPDHNSANLIDIRNEGGASLFYVSADGSQSAANADNTFRSLRLTGTTANMLGALTLGNTLSGYSGSQNFELGVNLPSGYTGTAAVFQNNNTEFYNLRPSGDMQVVGSGAFTQRANATLAGTTTANATTTISGVSTVFRNNVKIGDRIALSSAPSTYAVVTAIASDTILAVNSALGNGTSQTITVNSAPLVVRDNASATKLVVSGDGNVGVGTVNPLALFSVGTSSELQITSAGNLSTSGSITGTSGLTITGATVSINASSNFATNIGTGTSTGAISLGGGSNTFALDSTTLDISTAGAITGVTGIASSGAYTQSGSGANTFTGVSTFSAAGTALAVTNNATIGGTLNGQTISSVASFTGSFTIANGLTVTSGASSFGGDVSLNAAGKLTLNNSDNTNYYYLDNPGATGASNSVLRILQGNVGEAARFGASGSFGLGTSTLTSLLNVGTGAAFQVNSSGAIAAVTGVTSSGAYTQSGTNANTFTGVTTFSAAGTALSVTNNATIGGTLGVTGALTATTSVTSPIVNVGTAGASTGTLNLSGSTSGTITIQPQAVAGTYNFNLPTTAGTSGYVLTSAGGAGSPMTWTDPAALAVRWDSISNPTGNQSLTMGTNTSTWNYATGTSTNNLFNLTTDASANGTGALLNIQTGAGSTVLPARIRAGAVEAILVNASGNVGIGTTSPGAKLAISTDGTFALNLTHDGSNGVISTNAGGVNVQPTNGIVAFNKSSVQNRLRVYGSGGTNYGEFTNDNTNTIISSSSGELQLQGAGTNQLILGSVGSAMNLIFEESSTISGQGTNTITVGQSGDTFNLNSSGVTYNVAGLTSTGATLTTSATGTVAFTINGPSGLTANLLNLAVNGSNRLTVTTAGALSTVSSITSSVTGANSLALTGAPQASATASLVQMGSAIAGGSASGTYLGLNATGGFSGNFVDFQVSGTNYFKVTSAGATSSAATSAVFAANSATESAFQATGTPTASATRSLLQLGSTIAVGSTGGNYVGINSGSGFTGNFLELEKNSVQVLAVTADSQLSLTRATPVAADWTQLNSNGFGSANNITAHNLVTFGDALFIGTTNGVAGAQVYKSTDTTTWTQVNTTGFGSANNTAAIMGVSGGVLYAGTNNTTTGTQIWSSVDGATWTQVNTSGFGSAARTTTAAITSFGGAVYVATTNGETFRSFNGTTWTYAADLGGASGSGVRSFFTAQGYLYAASATSSGGGILERTTNGTTWSTVGTAGLGDTNNTEIASGMYYNGAYYFGTLNTTTGSKLYRSYDLTTFTQINTSGFGSTSNTTVRSLIAYNGSLYATTGNSSTGSQVYNSPDGAVWTQVNTSGFGSSATSTSLTAASYKGNLIIVLGNSSVGMKLYGVQTGTIKSTTGGLAVKSAQIGDVLIENATIKGVSELTAGTISAQTIGAKNLQVADGIAVNSSPTYTGNLVEYKANDTTVLSTTISGATKLSPWSFTSVFQTTTAETSFADVTSTANGTAAYNIYANSAALNDRTYFGFSDSAFTSFLYTETAGAGGVTGFQVCTALTSGVCTTWTTISGGSDGTTGMTASGTVSWTNTMTKGTVNGVSAYWVRLTVSSGMSPQANGTVRIASFETATATSAGVAFMLQAPYTASATGWSTNGTFIGVNRETAFSGNFLDFRAAGTSVFAITAAGGISVTSTSVSTTLLTVTQIASQTADTIAVGKVFVVDTAGKLASAESLPGVPLVGVDPNSGATRGDLTSSSGPLRPFAVAGLTLNITAGSAYTADNYTSGSRTTVRRCVIPSDTSIAMTASTTEYVYLIASTTDTTTGKQCTVAKNATLPTFNAQYPVLVLAKVVSGASITSVADTRFFIGSTLVYAVSTSSVEPGSIVIQNTAVDNQVDDSSSAASTGVAGITAVGNTASGIFILNKSGTAWAQAVSGAARGVCAGTSTTTGSVNNITAAVTACAGRVMTNAASATPAVLVQISPN